MHTHAKLLSCLGLLPFVGFALASYLAVLPADTATTAFLLYSALILSFLGGVHWSQAVLSKPNVMQAYVAMLPSLIGWCALLLLPESAALWLLCAAYLFILLYDMHTLDMPDGYLSLRIALTTLVVLCHLLLLLPRP
ncbi:DUF3429 domain-containing protein [Ferrimonas pelagia]|uniref:DUF3429 domain-containing protein n=1 Tax=Ferrimonas pelagia TaxID=1177826 RepID=A0ABP9FAJ1_9GAMM